MKHFAFLFILLLTASLFPLRPALATCSCQKADYSWETLASSDALTTEAECRSACTTEEGKDYIDGTTSGLAAEEDAAYERSKEVKARANDFAKNGLCQCYCGEEGEGAQAFGESGFENSGDCKDQCVAAGKQYVVCATSAEQAPLANPACWSEEDCKSDGSLWDTDKQPYQCAPTRRYCYPTPESVTLNVSIGEFSAAADIGTYINALYTYGLGAGALIAIVLIMVGGAQYIVGSGLGSVEAGKKRIKNAITGLVILLAAYLLLATVNPYLVSWQTLEIPKVKPIAFLAGSSCNDYDDLGYDADPTGKSEEVYCGNPGLVTSTPEGVEMTQECVYAKCTLTGQACIKLDDAYTCMSCTDAYKATISNGFVANASSCASLSATSDSIGTVNRCEYNPVSSFAVSTVPQNTCIMFEINCTAITKCEDYVNLKGKIGASTVALGSIPDVLENICTQNPCSETVTNGPCVFDEDAARVYALLSGAPVVPCASAAGQ